MCALSLEYISSHSTSSCPKNAILSDCTQYNQRRLSYLSRFDSVEKRNKQLKSKIKIVKRKPEPIRTDSQAEVGPEDGPKPVEQNTREITIVVKKWIMEMKERKSQSQQNFTPLKSDENTRLVES
jgi:hypothetical protein